MDKLHLALEIVGIISLVCGALSHMLKPGKAQEVVARLGTLASEVKAVGDKVEK